MLAGIMGSAQPGASASTVGGGGGGGSSPHRYYKLSFTAAQVDTSGKIALNEIIFAESAGGPQVVTSGLMSGPSFDAGSIGGLVDANWTVVNQIVAGTFPRNILIDFGATSANWKDINELRMAAGSSGWANQAPKDFTLYYSDDNSTWTSRIAVTSSATFASNNTSNIYRSAACADTISGYLYYRLNCTAGNQTSQFAVGELEFRATVSGSDLTTSTMAVFFSTQSGGNEAYRAFDDNNSTGYFSLNGSAYPQYLGTELEQRHTVLQASVIPYSGFESYAPKDFTIQGSNDLSAWTTVITATGQTGWAANPTARLFT